MTEVLADHRTRHAGPPLVLLAMVHIGLFLASLGLLSGGAQGGLPSPGADPDRLLAFFDANAGLLVVVGMMQLGAAVPLAIYAATASNRLEHLGVRAAGVTITLSGGIVAAAMMALSGLLTAAGGATAPALDASTAALLHQLTFFVGGVGFIVFFGLVLAGVGVTTLIAGLLPRWLSVATLAVFAVAEISILSLAIEPIVLAIPLARFAGMLALLAVAVSLPSCRRTS